MAALENEAGIAEEVEVARRVPRASRRRPNAPLPDVRKLRPGPGLSRAEVVANQGRRIFDGLAAALAYHGYEDTKIADVVELAGVSRATFYEHFQGKEACFAAAYDDGVERLAAAVVGAATEQAEWPDRVSEGLRAGLELLAAEPRLAHLLLVEAPAAARPARLEHERSLTELAEALRLPAEGPPAGETLSEDTARLLAGGLVSHLSGRVLAGEAERLPELHGVLLEYLLTPVAGRVASERRQAGRA